jgi:rod shape determining protein RodA
MTITARPTVTTRSVSPRRSGPIFDVVLAIAPILVACVGVVMVYTATRGELLAEGESPHTYLKKQALFVVIGVVVMVAVALFDYRRLEPLATPIYIITLLALLGVFAVGSSAQGAARWYSLGPLQLQPSEFAVIGLIIAIAAYCDRRAEDGLAWKDVFKLLIMAGIPIVLILKQPDLGTAIIMLIVLLIMLAVAGLPLRILIMLLLGVALAAVVATKAGLLHSYQIARLTTFLHPNSTSTNQFVQNAIYNVTQAKTAIGSGGFFGSGLLHGAQTNLGYVPEQQTDFIFTAVGEQLGFVGAVGLLAVLGVIAWRLLHAAGKSRDVFGRLICTGLFSFVAFSVFQNAGMTMGIMPITGIPLPFVSYGGTAVLCFFVAIGLALSVGARRRRV